MLHLSYFAVHKKINLMTDAVKAGERPATFYTLLSNLAMPAFFWFFIKPTFFGSSAP